MRMKRLFSLIALALIICAIGWARADATILPQLDVRVIASPGFVTEPGEIELQFTFENRGDTPLTGVSLTSPDGVSTENVGDVAADSYLTHSLTHNVTDAELSAGVVSYLITCNSGEKKYSFAIEATIGRAEPSTPVEFLRNVSSRFAPADGRLTVVYQVINRSSTPVTNAKVADALDGFLQEIDVINPGESVSLIHNVTVSDMMVSAPTLSYDRNDAHASIRLDDLALRAAHPAMRMDFSATPLENGGVQAVLKLTNAGDVDFRSITVYDELYGGVIADGLRLTLSGASIELTHEYPARSGGVYRWRVTYVDAAGETFSVPTDTVRVNLNAAVADSMTVSAEPKWEKIRRAGIVPITFTIQSTGFAENVRLFESTLGEIRTLTCVDSAEDTVWVQPVSIEESREYEFGITYTDASGTEQTVYAAPISIKIGTGGATPDSADGLTHTPFPGASMKVERSKWFVGVLIASVVVLIALSVTLSVLSRRARREQKQRDAARRQRLHDELGKTAPFTPLKRLANKDRGKNDVSGIQ